MHASLHPFAEVWDEVCISRISRIPWAGPRTAPTRRKTAGRRTCDARRSDVRRWTGTSGWAARTRSRRERTTAGRRRSMRIAQGQDCCCPEHPPWWCDGVEDTEEAEKKSGWLLPPQPWPTKLLHSHRDSMQWWSIKNKHERTDKWDNYGW